MSNYVYVVGLEQVVEFISSPTPTHTHTSLIKIFRCGGSDDSITLRSSDNSDYLTIVIESKGKASTYLLDSLTDVCVSRSGSDKVATFDMKLMDLDVEHLSIPVS